MGRLGSCWNSKTSWWLLQSQCLELVKRFSQLLNTNSLYFKCLGTVLSTLHGLFQWTFPTTCEENNQQKWSRGIMDCHSHLLDCGWSPWVFPSEREGGQKLLSGLLPCLKESRDTCGIVGTVEWPHLSLKRPETLGLPVIASFAHLAV